MNPKEPKELDNQAFGRSDAPEINPELQGISNRPGDEDPDSGVDREPGESEVEEPSEFDQPTTPNGRGPRN